MKEDRRYLLIKLLLKQNAPSHLLHENVIYFFQNSVILHERTLSLSASCAAAFGKDTKIYLTKSTAFVAHPFFLFHFIISLLHRSRF